MTTPNPGSPEAGEQGCTCAVIDNHYGRGMPYPDGPAFWISGDCPLHATCPCSSDNQPGDTCSACEDGTLPSTRAGAHTILEKDGDGQLQPTPGVLDQEGAAGLAAAPSAP